ARGQMRMHEVGATFARHTTSLLIGGKYNEAAFALEAHVTTQQRQDSLTNAAAAKHHDTSGEVHAVEACGGHAGESNRCRGKGKIALSAGIAARSVANVSLRAIRSPATARWSRAIR